LTFLTWRLLYRLPLGYKTYFCFITIANIHSEYLNDCESAELHEMLQRQRCPSTKNTRPGWLKYKTLFTQDCILFHIAKERCRETFLNTGHPMLHKHSPRPRLKAWISDTISVICSYLTFGNLCVLTCFINSYNSGTRYPLFSDISYKYWRKECLVVKLHTCVTTVRCSNDLNL